MQHSTIETIGTQSLNKVEASHCFCHFLSGECHIAATPSINLHLLILHIEYDVVIRSSLMRWTFVNFREIVRQLPLNYCLIFEDCHLWCFVYYLIVWIYRVCSPDLEQLIHILIKFFHLRLSNENDDVLNNLEVVKLFGYCQLFLLLLHLCSSSIPNWLLPPLLSFLFPSSSLSFLLPLSSFLLFQNIDEQKCW